MTILLVHELQKTITRIVIWSLPCLVLCSTHHAFPRIKTTSLICEKDFWVKTCCPSDWRTPLPLGGGGRRVRGESWKLILYCIFSAAARPLKLYFFAWPPMIPTNAAPILLCSTGWAFGLVSKFHCGDLYKWDSPTAGHLQHFFKTTVTNVQSLELMEPLIPYLPLYNARPVHNTHPHFWPLYSKKKKISR